MALSHFWLQAKSGLTLHRIGLLPARSRLYASLGSSNGNVQQKLVANEPIVKEKEVGSGLKDFALKFKSKLLRTLQPLNHNKNDASTPAEHAASTIIESRMATDCGRTDGRDPELVFTSELIIKSQEKDTTSNHEASGMVHDSSSSESVNQLSLEVKKIKEDSASPESEDANAFSMQSISSLTGEKNCKDEVTKLIDPEPMDQQSSRIKSCEVVSSSLVDLDRHLMSDPENIYSFQPQTLVRECGIVDGRDSSSPASAEFGNIEQAEKMPHNLPIDSGSKEDADPGSNNVKSLHYRFRKFKPGKSATIGEDERLKHEETLAELLFSFSRDRKSSLPQNLSSSHVSPSQEINDLPEAVSLNERHRELEECGSLSSEGVKSSPQIGGSQKMFQTKDSHVKPAYELEAEEGFGPRSLVFTHLRGAQSNERNREEAEKTGDIKNLIDLIRTEEASNSSNESGNFSSSQENSSAADIEMSDDDDDSNSEDFETVSSLVKEEQKNASDLESKSSRGNSIVANNEHKRQAKASPLAGKASEKNRVRVRFISKYATESDISEAFSTCGRILGIHYVHSRNSKFKTAYIYFKTRKEVENALRSNEILVRQGSVIVESAASVEKTSAKIQIPSLIGDPSIPKALVKNPSRTIKIEKLTPEISSCHIEDALGFCQSNISGYYLGSSNSVAYVEFETEKGKERALAKHSITVLGENLVMLRIDAPRTTVVRISFPGMQSNDLTKHIHSIYKSLGALRSSQRCSDVLDVHFRLADWPNMLNIINRLNGLEIEGGRLQAEPAPIFPPAILSALWQQPEERKHVKRAIEGLVHNLGMPYEYELARLQDEFFLSLSRG